MAALRDSHSLAIARIGGNLVGLGNAISDGHLVAYYPHLSAIRAVDDHTQRWAESRSDEITR